MANKTNYSLHTLFWEATLRCNAHCDFCGSRCGENSSLAVESEAPSTDVCNAFRDIAQEMDPAKIMINVTGGEPLLRKDLFQVMQYATELGFPWGMVTNGCLIDEEIVTKMKNSGMRTISISLDGLPETHDMLRKINNGFERIERAVRLLAEATFLDELQITTVVNHRNIDELEKLFQTITNWSIDSWRLAIVDPIGRAAENRGLLLTQEDYKKYFSFIDSHQFNGKIAITTSCSHYLGSYDNLYRPHSFTCETGKTVASILANGDIYVCPNVPRRLNLIQGNIKKDSFSEKWNNGFQWFRDPERQKAEKCSKCGYWHQCKGDSLHTWDFDNSSPNVCYTQLAPVVEAPCITEDRIKNELLKFYPQMQGHRVSYGSSSGKKIIVSPHATNNLKALFGWNERTPWNQYELLAGLAGYQLGDLTVVESIIPGYLEDRGQTKAAFSKRSYLELQKELQIINSCLEDSEKVFHLWGDVYALLGIAHSHPGNLKPTMSIPDMQLHEKIRSDDRNFVSLILNPHQGSLCAFSDSVFSPVDIEFLTSV